MSIMIVLTTFTETFLTISRTIFFRAERLLLLTIIFPPDFHVLKTGDFLLDNTPLKYNTDDGCCQELFWYNFNKT